MSLMHETSAKLDPKSNNLQIQGSTSSSKKIKDFLFKGFPRRKSTSLAPNAHELHRNSIGGGSNSPKYQRKNGNLAPINVTLLGPGAARPRSQSVYSPTSALQPELAVQEKRLPNAGSSGDVNRIRLNSGSAPNQDLSTPELEKVFRSNDSSSNVLPMSRLLSSSRRDSMGGDSSPTPPPQPNNGQQQTLLTVGPSEFCEMFRGRTYSDSKNAEARLAVMDARKRKTSDVKSPLTSVKSCPLEVSEDPTFAPVSPPPVNNDRPQGLSPQPAPSNFHFSQTIPEHVEVQFNDKTSPPLSPTKLTHHRARRVSTYGQPVTSAGGRGLGDELGEESAGLDDRGRRERRYSEPFTSGLSPDVVVGLGPGSMLRHLTRESASKAMSNFPKHTTTVPKSLISSKDLGIDLPREHRPLVIWKDKLQGTHMFRLPLDDEEWHELTCEDPEVRNGMYYRTMKRRKCFELMPHSSKLVLLDKELLVISSFYALMFNGIRAAPVWDSDIKAFIGMLTVTDFIRVLDQYYSTQDKSIDLEGHKISTWIGILNGSGHHKNMITVDPDDSFLEALGRLKDNRIHRLLVADRETGSSLHILTHKRILHYLYLLTHDLPKPAYMKQSIGELNVGTYENIATITTKTRLIEALRLMITSSVSSLPVLDDQRHVVNIYSRSDVINLVSNESYKNLDNSIEEALSIPRESFEGLYICSRHDTLETVMNWLVRMNVHRIMVTDEERRLVGVVSISDILNYIVLQQAPPPTPDNLEIDSRVDMEKDVKMHTDTEIQREKVVQTNPEILIEFCEKL